MRVTRISSMVEGLPCAFMIDDNVKYYPVQEKRGQKFVNMKGRPVHEEELPMGEEVII